MKLKFSLKNKEIGFDADVEGIVEKSLNYKKDRPIKKTRYQIKQEEKRKNREQKFEQDRRLLIAMGVALIVIFLICICCSIFLD